MQYLPDQSAKAMGDCPDRLCIAQANGEAVEDDLQVAVSLVDGSVG
jgi:hypothetical protein